MQHRLWVGECYRHVFPTITSQRANEWGLTLQVLQQVGRKRIRLKKHLQTCIFFSCARLKLTFVWVFCLVAPGHRSLWVFYDVARSPWRWLGSAVKVLFVCWIVSSLIPCLRMHLHVQRVGSDEPTVLEMVHLWAKSLKMLYNNITVQPAWQPILTWCKCAIREQNLKMIASRVFLDA